jgi:phenylpropionate dioxygenase-like ring-hydroxylating dioxygenase large terminal subunit
MTPFPAGLSATWAPVALSRQLKTKPLARQIADVPIVLFRGPSGVTALEDRCPHRNYPLSDGEVENGVLRCPYHGWRFDGAGACVEVPGADPAQPLGKLGARRLAVVERHGAIFVRLDGDAPLELPPLVGDPDHDHFWWTRAPWRGRALDALENILDPFHTNFIHDGLIRMSRRRQAVRQTLTFREDGFEVAYDQDSPDVGWMSRLLEGERQRSVGRYFPPITFQGRWEDPDVRASGFRTGSRRPRQAARHHHRLRRTSIQVGSDRPDRDSADPALPRRDADAPGRGTAHDLALGTSSEAHQVSRQADRLTIT